MEDNDSKSFWQFMFIFSVTINIALILCAGTYFAKSRQLENKDVKKNTVLEEKIRKLSSAVNDADIAIEKMKKEIAEFSETEKQETVKLDDISKEGADK